jgi:hypothetical protein
MNSREENGVRGGWRSKEQDEGRVKESNLMRSGRLQVNIGGKLNMTNQIIIFCHLIALGLGSAFCLSLSSLPFF